MLLIGNRLAEGDGLWVNLIKTTMPLYKSIVVELAKQKQKHNLSGLFGVIGRFTPLMDVNYGFVRSLSGILPGLQIPAHLPDQGAVNEDKELFRLLGFDGIETIDQSDYEGAEHIVDMNQPLDNPGLIERFDVIANNGSLEHIFNVPNCLNNMTRMLKVGGHVIHWVPLNNWVDHGFYQISPALLIDYYLDNNFAVRDGKIFQYVFSQSDRELDIRYVGINGVPSYATLHYPFASIQGKFDGGMYGYVFVAQKLKESTATTIPSQSQYSSPQKQKERLDKLTRYWQG